MTVLSDRAQHAVEPLSEQGCAFNALDERRLVTANSLHNEPVASYLSALQHNVITV